MEEEKSDKLSATIKLGLWLVFIIIMVVISMVGGKKNEVTPTDNQKDEQKVKITYDEKLTNLKDNFAYAYTINVNNVSYKYVGKKLGEKEAGILTFGDNTKNYYQDRGYIYEVIDGGLNQISDLYNKINKNYIDLNYIKELIKTQEYTVNNHTYTYNFDNLTINIKTDETNVISIEIKENNDLYLLEYNDIGKIEKIDY